MKVSRGSAAGTAPRRQGELRFEGGTHAASGGKTRPPKYGGSHQSYVDETRDSRALAQHGSLEGSQLRGPGADIIGEKVGTYTVRALTDASDTASTRIVELRCECDRSKFMPATEVRRYQRNAMTPRCYCDAYKKFIALRGVMYERRCGLCKATTHAIAACPKRKPAKWCGLCAGLAHRVGGIKCRACGKRYRAEPPVELDVTGLGSSAGQLERFALGGDTGDAVNRRVRKARAA